MIPLLYFFFGFVPYPFDPYYTIQIDHLKILNVNNLDQYLFLFLESQSVLLSLQKGWDV